IVMATSRLDYISVGCNSISDCIAWGRNGLVAYGANNFVALMRPDSYQRSQVIATLPGHKDRVNHVVWVPGSCGHSSTPAPECELISASSDHSLISWRRYEKTEVLKSHTDSVTSCSVVRFPDGTLLMSSTSGDGTVKIWKRDALPTPATAEIPKWTVIQTIEFKPKMMECCSLAFLPGTDNIPILALGGVESKIHIFVQYPATTTTTATEGEGSSSSQPATYIKAMDTPFRKVVALQGHQDELLLASSSQDNKIRLWKVSKQVAIEQKQDSSTDDNIEKTASDVVLALASTALSTKAHKFNVGQSRVMIQLEAVLSGHEDWVQSINWMPATYDNETKAMHQDMCLISASMDKTMIVWRPEKTSGIWMDEVRVGDLGGNILGLYGGVFSPTGEYILSHGYNGAFHLWRQSSSFKMWEPQIIPSGHFAAVQDLMWSPDFNYFITASSDRTLRLYAEWLRDVEDDNNNVATLKSWNEIARPQIHGYDLECFSFIHTKNHAVVSGAEEKILRVFLGSQNFIDTLSNITKIKYENDGQQRPLAANQPSLGLSNKPFFSAEQQQGDDGTPTTEFAAQMAAEDNEALGEGGFEEQVYFNPEVLDQPPFEEHLLQSSLWPEIQKLYGHGNEIISVACSYDGKYLASTCRASSADQATVRIWDVATWKEVANLKGHTLTVVQLAFSHDNRYLLGVSRDRMWTLWQRQDNSEEPFVKVASVPKSHGRIVWGCSWSHDDRFFVTGSRDKVVKIWSNGTKEKPGWSTYATLPTFESGVTATEFAPRQPHSDNSYLLAVGEEDGKITIWRGDQQPDVNVPIDWKCIHTIATSLSHTSDVRRIRWRANPETLSNGQTQWQLATCSTDQSVRLFTLSI
ncbi:hypothetical protein SAMD00019534_013620, partial [Acytostelium subglobosum LB1]|uniref:hypothetical protein n=1 Tax=Acytostelium subglobosum LB1 TaxID=1410327 RepID=UPI000644B392